jgi:hypothetical protein
MWFRQWSGVVLAKDREYYRCRLEQERSAEAAATSWEAREAHRKLADCYAAKLRNGQPVKERILPRRRQANPVSQPIAMSPLQ